MKKFIYCENKFGLYAVPKVSSHRPAAKHIINGNIWEKNTLEYIDNLNLKNVKGTLYIKDQQVSLENMTSSIFDGALSISGDVSTKNETPTFNLKLNANGFDIAKSFKDLELLQSLAPIAKLLQGKLNTGINLSGELDW